MEQITTTPFGARPVTAGHLARAQRLRALGNPAPAGSGAATSGAGPGEGEENGAGAGPDKWALLRDLAVGRRAFGVTDRDLAVLGALLSFHPERRLDLGPGLIVFPSNAALGGRAHGMAESTLRRHLAALVAAGLIQRHDSPNGKRYAARDAGGSLVRAFGLDLAPLVLRAAEIEAAALAAREAALRLKRARETAMLRLRDAEKLATYGLEAAPRAMDWAEALVAAAAARRRLRRKLEIGAIEAEAASLGALLTQIGMAFAVEEVGAVERAFRPAETLKTEKMSGDAGDFGRLHHSSKTDPLDSENCLEEAMKTAEATQSRTVGAAEPDKLRCDPEYAMAEPNIPFSLVAKACPEIGLYAGHGLDGWSDLLAAADFVRPMLGVSPDAWAAAKSAMGPAAAAATLACILERADRIASPGGYLRALTAKARGPGFSPLPMIAALLSARDATRRVTDGDLEEAGF